MSRILDVKCPDCGKEGQLEVEDGEPYDPDAAPKCDDCQEADRVFRSAIIDRPPVKDDDEDDESD